MKTIVSKSLTFYYKENPLKPVTKTVFFFCLSAENSLTLPPFCHPVDTLLDQGIRVVSITLPSHENNTRPLHIQKLWLEQIDQIETFIEDLSSAVKELTTFFPPPYGAMGISRGAFIALHLSALVEEITSIVAFAPMLGLGEEKKLSIFPLISKLANKKIHFFVGHKDTTIITEQVILLTNNIIEESKGLNPNLLLKIYPSTGRNGHGTPDSIFTQGALWMKNIL